MEILSYEGNTATVRYTASFEYSFLPNQENYREMGDITTGYSPVFILSALETIV
jgi:hypothetical protein